MLYLISVGKNAVLVWGHSFFSEKGSAQMGRVKKAGFIGDAFQRFIGIGKISLSGVNPAAAKVFGDGDAGIFLKQGAQIGRVPVKNFGQLRQGDFFGVMHF